MALEIIILKQVAEVLEELQKEQVFLYPLELIQRRLAQVALEALKLPAMVVTLGLQEYHL